MKTSLLLLVITCLTSCGIETGQSLKVVIYGINVEPADVQGDTTPYSIKLSLESITFLASASGGVPAFSGPAQEITVVDRKQRILDYDISNYKGETISDLTINLGTSYVASTLQGEVSGNLTSGAIVYGDTFEVETGKSVTIDYQINWKNIIGIDTLTEPTFTIQKD